MCPSEVSLRVCTLLRPWTRLPPPDKRGAGGDIRTLFNVIWCHGKSKRAVYKDKFFRLTGVPVERGRPRWSTVGGGSEKLHDILNVHKFGAFFGLSLGNTSNIWINNLKSTVKSHQTTVPQV